uniref:Uncharacterized protein n=1 Tax=Parascaris equorum TaxID=6256 RepID=A0A914RCQ0_PAREQ
MSTMEEHGENECESKARGLKAHITGKDIQKKGKEIRKQSSRSPADRPPDDKLLQSWENGNGKDAKNFTVL